jgi:predicted alpha/beta superfamily hydrolase
MCILDNETTIIMNIAQRLFLVAQTGAETKSAYHYSKIIKKAEQAAESGKFKVIYSLDGDERLSDKVITRLRVEGFKVNETGDEEDLDEDETQYTISW